MNIDINIFLLISIDSIRDRLENVAGKEIKEIREIKGFPDQMHHVLLDQMGYHYQDADGDHLRYKIKKSPISIYRPGFYTSQFQEYHGATTSGPDSYNYSPEQTDDGGADTDYDPEPEGDEEYDENYPEQGNAAPIGASSI